MGTVPAHTSQPGWAVPAMPFGDVVDMAVSPVRTSCINTEAHGCSPFSGSPKPSQRAAACTLPCLLSLCSNPPVTDADASSAMTTDREESWLQLGGVAGNSLL